MKTAKPAEPQAPKKPLTLADISVTWREGSEEHTINSQELAFILEHARRISTNFSLLVDAGEADGKLRAAEDFVQAIAHTQENGDEVSLEALWQLRDLVQDARVRYGLSSIKNFLKPEAFDVKINTPAPAGGAR